MQIGTESISPVRLRRLRQTAGAVVATASVLVLCGWLFHITVLKSVLPHLVTMKANTAVCLLLAGLALWLWPERNDSLWRQHVIAGCAVLIALIGLLTLVEYGTGLDLGIDELLFRDFPLSPATSFPGRMGPHTALNHVFIGSALLLARSSGRGVWLSQLFALLSGLIAFIVFVGYLYSLTQFIGFVSYGSMGLHTSLCFLVLSFGLLSLHPADGVMRLAMNPGLAGVVLRRLLPLTSLVLLALSWLIQQGRAAGFYGVEWSAPLMVVTGIVVMSPLIWWTALALARLEAARERAVGEELTERRHAEEALRASEQRFRQLFETMDEGYCVIEVIFDEQQQPVDYRFLEVNPAFERQTGIGDARGRLMREIAPNHEQYWFNIYGRIALTGETLRFENPAAALGRYYDVCAFRVGLAELHRVGIVFNDITERRQTENRVRELLARLESLITYAPVGIALFDPELRYLSVNDRVALMDGLPKEAYPGGTVSELLPEIGPQVESRLRQVRDTGQAVVDLAVSGTTPARPGQQRHWIASYYPVRTADNILLGIGAITLEITEQKQAQEALRENEERYRVALEGSPVVVYTCDRELRFTWVYNSLLPVTDLRLILGRRDDEILPPEAVRELVEIKQRVLDGGKGERCEVCVPFNGHRYYFDYKTEPLRDATGAIIGLRGAAWDISERKRAEAEREFLLAQEQELRAKAEAATRSKDEFLSVVSHELRNPLNSILGYTRLARAQASDAATVVHYCDIIERSARMQQQLIEDLLDTARIISGKLKIEAAPTDLRVVLEEALSVVRPAAEAQKINLIARPGDEPVMVIGDAARLRQIAWNLLQNAIKFTPEGGRIELHLERDSEQARIIVSDSGKGIEPEFLPHLFERFSQHDMSYTRRHGGLGLGLALVRELVELHSGLITAASAGAGQGATFTVTLPLQAAEFIAPQPSVRAVAKAHTGPQALPLDNLPRLDGVRVLVVDDQEEARLLVSKILDEWGAAALTAASGHEALALLSAHQFDVLVCDITMPDEDGYEVLRRIRDLEAHQGISPAARLPAIALTALSRAEDRRRALTAGFQMHLAKPVEPAELIVVIASITRHRLRGATVD